jgi:nucleotide-binding universal stress UspA family protein
MQIKTILVPCDFSDHSEQAFQWAIGLAERWSARIVLVHAAQPFSHLAYPESVYLIDLAKMEAEILADAEKRLNEFAAKKGASSVTVDSKVMTGDPFWEI